MTWLASPTSHDPSGAIEVKRHHEQVREVAQPRTVTASAKLTP